MCLAAVLCGDAAADVVFLVDNSMSVCNSSSSCSRWQSVLEFIVSLINRWTISPSRVQVGLVRYSATTSSYFYLSTYTQKSQLINATRALAYITENSQVGNLQAALVETRNNQFQAGRGSRYGVRKIEVILTNGGSLSSLDRTSLCTEANVHRNLGIMMYSVGVSARVTDNDLQCISSPPQLRDFNYYINADDIGFDSIAAALSPALCNSANTDCSRKVMDLVFLLDSSNTVNADGPSGWSSVLSFVSNTISGLSIGSMATRVGVVTFSDTAQNPIWLNSYDDKPTLIAAIRALPLLGGNTVNILAGLNSTLTQQFTTARGDRETASNVAVLITTSKSTGDAQATAAEADKLHAAGIKVFAVGVTTRVDVVQLVNISSLPRLQYHQWWYASNLDAALNDVQSSFQVGLCKPEYG